MKKIRFPKQIVVVDGVEHPQELDTLRGAGLCEVGENPDYVQIARHCRAGRQPAPMVVEALREVCALLTRNATMSSLVCGERSFSPS